MQCRQCGTEIADKAIVCYRCGTATTDPVRRPAPAGASRRSRVSLVAAIVPMLLAFILVFLADRSGYPEAFNAAAAVLAAVGVVLLGTRLLSRR
jgi:hypothetical protein